MAAPAKRPYDDPEGEKQLVQKRTHPDDNGKEKKILYTQKHLDMMVKDTNRIVASFLHGDRTKKLSMETPWAYAGQERHPVQAHPDRVLMAREEKSDAVAMSLVNKNMRDQLKGYVGTGTDDGTNLAASRVQTAVRSLEWVHEWVRMTRGKFLPMTEYAQYGERHIQYQPHALRDMAATQRDGGEKLYIPVPNRFRPTTKIKVPGTYPVEYKEYNFYELMQYAWTLVFPRDEEKEAKFHAELGLFMRKTGMEPMPWTPTNPYEMLSAWLEQSHIERTDLDNAAGLVLSAIHAFGGEQVWTAFVWYDCVHPPADGIYRPGFEKLHEFIWLAQAVDMGKSPTGRITMAQIDEIGDFVQGNTDSYNTVLQQLQRLRTVQINLRRTKE